MGVAGLDHAEARARLSSVPGLVAAHLLDEAEAGLLKGLAAQREDGD
jgi:hypothetical protein